MILDDILINLKENGETYCYIVDDKKYSYLQLYSYTCNLYKLFMQKNFSKKPIIIYGNKDIYMKASILACLFAGITYIPIDAYTPKSRVLSIVEQTSPAFIVGDFKNELVPNIEVDTILQIMNSNKTNEIDNIYLKKNDTAYIIFTSGSTGTPKGVEVTYSNLDSCVSWLQKETNTKNKSVILNQASFSFDLSVADFYLSLLKSNCHFILSNSDKKDFKQLFNKLKNSNANLAVFTPSFADFLLLDKNFNSNLLPYLKKIIFCGEKLLNSTVTKLFNNFKNLEIINCYGPTECTFAVTSVHLHNEKEFENDIPIGYPKCDVEISIVDNNCNLVSNNEIGEILISGKSVAKGYLGKASNSFLEFKGKPSYLTGDLGYYKNDILFFCNRKDSQIKYKGYRIELNDIENNLYKLKYIEKAVVTPLFYSNGNIKKIICFVKLKDTYLKSIFNIKNDLLKYLPQYMIPVISLVSYFPLNKNGKCDTKKLLEDYCNGK